MPLFGNACQCGAASKYPASSAQLLNNYRPQMRHHAAAGCCSCLQQALNVCTCALNTAEGAVSSRQLCHDNIRQTANKHAHTGHWYLSLSLAVKYRVHLPICTHTILLTASLDEKSLMPPQAVRSCQVSSLSPARSCTQQCTLLSICKLTPSQNT